MSLKIYNTLSRKKEEFKSLLKKKVKMYVCGPTVYNYVHVGNARVMVFFDVVCRYLKSKGYEVTYIRNITDIDDKIIQKSIEEKRSSLEVSSRYIKIFEQDMEKLELLKPDVSPKATEHIPKMIDWTQALIQKDYAYESQGEILYSIQKFRSYGKLSKKKTEDLVAGARVDVSAHKKNPLDFVLWKPSKPNEPYWESPWGRGRPGWHIECSVMSTQYLGETFDIHGGGMDLIFPHHENEIAQSEAYTENPFSKYWIHVGMLVFGKEKMSKSLGNIITVHEFLDQYPGELLKFILLSNHYRSSLDFSEEVIADSKTALERIYKTLLDVKIRLGEKPKEQTSVSSELKTFTEGLWSKFEEAMEDDFNTAEALGVIFNSVRVMNKNIMSASPKMLELFLETFSRIGKVWGLFEKDPASFLSELRTGFLKELELSKEEIGNFIRERNQARDQKDWKKADEIRGLLKKHKIILEDSAQGTTWKVEK